MSQPSVGPGGGGATHELPLLAKEEREDARTRRNLLRWLAICRYHRRPPFSPRGRARSSSPLRSCCCSPRSSSPSPSFVVGRSTRRAAAAPFPSPPPLRAVRQCPASFPEAVLYASAAPSVLARILKPLPAAAGVSDRAGGPRRAAQNCAAGVEGPRATSRTANLRPDDDARPVGRVRRAPPPAARADRPGAGAHPNIRSCGAGAARIARKGARPARPPPSRGLAAAARQIAAPKLLRARRRRRTRSSARRSRRRCSRCPSPAARRASAPGGRQSRTSPRRPFGLRASTGPRPVRAPRS